MSTNLIKNSLFNDAVNDLSLNYGSVLKSIADFRKSNGKYSQQQFDNPQTYYFKLFFFFDDEQSKGQSIDSSGIPTSNLLGLTYDGDIFDSLPWEEDFKKPKEWNTTKITNHKTVNTALNYLLINYEWDRAKKLTEFIKLLSEISYKYPWYFASVSGLNDALTRKEFTETEFKIEEQRRKIQIKCLPDSEDNKIGRLLDLYRNITYSQLMKKEILPSNLRKFDMGIFIFSRPLKNMHRKVSRDTLINNANSGKDWDEPQNQNDTSQSTGTSNIYADFTPELNPMMGDRNFDRYKTSYKYIELHNCEIDYNSSASAYSDLKNDEGFNQEYSIDIYFDDAFENRYDEVFLKNIGDFSIWDLNLNEDNISGQEEAFWSSLLGSEKELANIRLNEYTIRKNLLKFNSNEISKKSQNERTSEKNDMTTSEGVGINAEDLKKKGGDNKIGRMWEGKYTQQDGLLTQQLRSLGQKYYKQYVTKPYKKFVLGNFYNVQFKKLTSGVNKVLKGDVIGAAKTFKNFANGWKKK